MADKDLPINCKIKEPNVDVGSGKKDTNKIVLEVTNTSAESISFSGLGACGEFSIAVSIGKGPEDLVATSEGRPAIDIQAPDKWKRNSYKNIAGQATWSYRLPNTVLSGGEAVRFILAKFESHTDPGKAKITIGAKITGYNDYKTNPPLEAEKKTEEFDLLYFTADPPYIITDEDRNKFKLTWNAVKAQRAVLYGNNARIEEFTVGSGGFQSGKPFTYANEMPSFTTVYKLVVTDKVDESKRKEQQVTVQVLAPGWHKVAFFRYGNPSMLCNVDGVKFYGIFVKEGKASLYSSEYPLSGWTLENNYIPDGMQTSPSVCFHNKLWLVGGSTADPDIRNNEIYCYEKVSGKWRKQKQVPWTARMGHACVVFNNKLWVLGGNDETGASKNEVWAAGLEGEELNWNKSTAEWESRCMFAATVFNDKIWLYGGAKEPYGLPIKDIWSFSGEGQWQVYKINPSEGAPIGCALQEIKNKLNLFAALQRDNSVVARKCVLSEVQQLWRLSEIPETAWLDQVENTFSLISVDYRGLVYLIWQDYKIYNEVSGQLFLNVYSPGS